MNIGYCEGGGFILLHNLLRQIEGYSTSMSVLAYAVFQLVWTCSLDDLEFCIILYMEMIEAI